MKGGIGKEGVLLLLCITGFIWMSGCSADDNPTPVIPNSDMIIASAQSLSQPFIETKAPYSDTIPSTDSPLRARVLASKTSGSYANLHADGTMTFVNSEKTPYDTEDFWGKNFYELDGSSLYFCGLYPAVGWSESPTTTASFTFTGKEDVMFAPQKTSSITQATQGPEFTFNHLLTRLNITLFSENEGMLSSWGEITDLALINTPNKVTVSLGETDIETMTPVYSGDTIVSAHLVSDDTPISDYSTGISIALAEDEPTAQAYILAASVNATNSSPEYSLYIKTSNGSERTIPLNLKTDSDVDFEGSTRGRLFNVSLNFQGDEINVEVANTDDITIGKWTTSLILQTIMFTSVREHDAENMVFGLNVLNRINANSVSHTYSYFGLYGVNDITHDMEFDVAKLEGLGLLSSFKTGQHVMFDLKKLIRTWGTDPENGNRISEIVLKNYESNWELAPAMQTINTLDHPDIDWETWAREGNHKIVDGITSATLPATNGFPKTAAAGGDTTNIQPSTTLTNKGTIIIRRK
ncbi:fimbrillin family protein [Parabacteroides sp. OttesenSCG-928-G07]|nr:fimbrillin family protein [Parabacteroides sp. OttesenSCG-928-G21]MDL2277411.1 fimbrillin family protein [Parabacteroides sp. OttesenSCG-928-G07]